MKKAPLWRAPSDVTRFRGVLAASILTPALAVAALWVTQGFAGLSSPGALSPSHQKALADCSSCHADNAAQATCAACHSGQSSRRAGHQGMLAEGKLSCTSCHRAHLGARLTFNESGAFVQRGAQTAALPEAHAAYRPARAMTLPLVERSSCAPCHQLNQPQDPASACFTAAFDPYQACFDEHRSVGELPSDRDALWTAALEVMRPGLPRPETPLAPWAILAGALLVGALAVSGIGHVRQTRVRTVASAPQAAQRVRLPQVNTSTCLGCSACVDVCPFDVLEVRQFVAVVARPDACCGLTLCEQRCPNGSLVVREGAAIDDRPNLDDCLESMDVPGLFLAGDLTGLSLIRNAIEQGAHVAHTVAERSRGRTPQGTECYDLLVVGTGPAGLSAIVEAARLGLRAVALEQGSVAESIRSFPRHKLVLDQGGSESGKASLWLEQCTKEKLVSKWTQIARRARLPILEAHRMTGVERLANGEADARFRVWADCGRSEQIAFAARHVLLALGKRGTPRKLPLAIPHAFSCDVHYVLLDARAFAGRRVLVVGLGDTAMEAAVALAGQPDCQVTIVARARGFNKGKTKNIQAVEQLVKQDKLLLYFNSKVMALGDQDVKLSVGGVETSIAVDSIFVLIGAEPPWPLLEKLGVRRGAIGETSSFKLANRAKACGEDEQYPS